MGRQSRRKRRRPIVSPPPPGQRITLAGVPRFVNSSPLQKTRSVGHRSTRVVRPNDQQFDLAPSIWEYILASLGMLFSSWFGLGGVLGMIRWLNGTLPTGPKASPPWVMPILIIVWAVILRLMVRMMTRHTRFDRTRGTMAVRALWRTTHEVQLRDVVAVQCLYAGQRVSRGPRGGSSWHEYQINLLLADGPDSRVNVCAEPNGRWVRATATELAAFLGTPLIDHFAVTDAPCDQPRRS